MYISQGKLERPECIEKGRLYILRVLNLYNLWILLVLYDICYIHFSYKK